MSISRFETGPRMSQMAIHNGLAYLSGQVPDDYQSSIEEQTRQVLQNIDKLSAQAGTNKSNLLSIEVYLPHISDFDTMNKIYDIWIDPANPSTRVCSEARLASPDLRVEMKAVAAI